MDEFYRIKRLPPYVFAIVNDLKVKARARGDKASIGRNLAPSLHSGLREAPGFC